VAVVSRFVSTIMATFCARPFLNDTAEDLSAILQVLSQVLTYPFSAYDSTMKT
jgi:hypothetical protein